jgi:Domain of unknown function (DUF4261)
LRKLFSRLGTAMSVFGLAAHPANAEEAKDDASSPLAFAMLVLSDSELPRSADVAAYIREHWPNLPALKESESESDGLFFETAEGYIVHAGLIDAPIPAGELDFPCATNFAWEGACDAVGKMQSFAIITTLPLDNQPLRAHVYNTVMVQAVSALSNSVGIYWGNGSNFWSPEQFADAALTASFDDPPYLLWVGHKMQREADGSISFFTIGMPHFGTRDLEVQHSRADVSSTFDTLRFVSLYLARNGPVIKDGDTLGSSADERIRVTVGTSVYDPEKEVYRLDL